MTAAETAIWPMLTCAIEQVGLLVTIMSRLFTQLGRRFLRCAAVVVALMVMISSWCPPGWMVCLHHDGEVHLVSCVAHEQMHDGADQEACCAHNGCIDVVIEMPEANRFAPVVAPLAASVPVTIHWFTYRDGLSLVAVHRCASKLLAPPRGQFAFGPPDGPISTFRTLSLQV